MSGDGVDLGTPKDLVMTDITDPQDSDVLCGRGGAALRHPGNQTYRRLVNLNKGLYITCLKTEKLKISRSIVAAIREQRGRFLEKDNKKNSWYDIGDKKAVEKTSQALREGQPKLRQKIVEMGGGAAGTQALMESQFGSAAAAAATGRHPSALYNPEQVGLTPAAASDPVMMQPPTGAAPAAPPGGVTLGSHMEMHKDMLARMSLTDINSEEADSFRQRRNLFLQQQMQQQSQRSNNSHFASGGLGMMPMQDASQLSLMSDYSGQMQGSHMSNTNFSVDMSVDSMLIHRALADMENSAHLRRQMAMASGGMGSGAMPAGNLYSMGQFSIPDSSNNSMTSITSGSAHSNSTMQQMQQMQAMPSLLGQSSQQSGGFQGMHPGARPQMQYQQQQQQQNVMHPDIQFQPGGNSGRGDDGQMMPPPAAVMPREQQRHPGAPVPNHAIGSPALGSGLGKQSDNAPGTVRGRPEDEPLPLVASSDSEQKSKNSGDRKRSPTTSLDDTTLRDLLDQEVKPEPSTAATAPTTSSGVTPIKVPVVDRPHSPNSGDRRGVFAKMKYSRNSPTPADGNKKPTVGANQETSTDDMPDIHFVESSMSLCSGMSILSIGGESSTKGLVGAAGGPPKKQPHEFEIAKVVDHSAREGGSQWAGGGASTGGGSKRSLMSGLSANTMDQSLFSDLSKKIGDVSTRSLASDISAIDLLEETEEEGESETASVNSFEQQQPGMSDSGLSLDAPLD